MCSEELRTQLALASKQMCTEKIDIDCSGGESPTSSLEAFLACRLIPLDKNPGLRPIGVGEVLRRIVGKVVMKVFRPVFKKQLGPYKFVLDSQVAAKQLSMPCVTSLRRTTVTLFS